MRTITLSFLVLSSKWVPHQIMGCSGTLGPFTCSHRAHFCELDIEVIVQTSTLFHCPLTRVATFVLRRRTVRAQRGARGQEQAAIATATQAVKLINRLFHTSYDRSSPSS